MHRALQISEILEMILRSIEEFRKPTAAAVASTCRTFYELASDILWEDMPRLQPLLSLLPGDMLVQSGSRLDMARELGGEQRARFLKHAARVRILRLTDEDSTELKKHLRIILVMRSRSTSAMFPNLRSLEVGRGFPSRGRPNATHLLLFLSPKTRTVQLKTEDEFISQALDQLAISCPQLQCIEVPSFPRGSVEILSCFDALEEIRCSDSYRGGDPVDLAFIARLPMLRHLSIPLRDDLSGIAITGDRGTTFAALETLELRNIDVASNLVFILQPIRFTRLRNLSIKLTSCYVDQEIEVADQALSMLAKFPELRSLHFGGYSSKSSAFPPVPVLKLHNLEELHLDIGSLLLSKQSIIDLAQACPKLRRLQVFDMHGLNEENLRPWSLNALEWFATHLPMLEYLETNFDTYTIHTLETPLARSLVPISLVLGFLTLLHEKDWWHIAAYISCVYPNAKCGLGNSWDSVADEELRSDQLHWRYVARAVAKARADNC